MASKINVFLCDVNEDAFTVDPGTNVSTYRIRSGYYMLIVVE